MWINMKWLENYVLSIQNVNKSGSEQRILDMLGKNMAKPQTNAIFGWKTIVKRITTWSGVVYLNINLMVYKTQTRIIFTEKNGTEPNGM